MISVGIVKSINGTAAKVVVEAGASCCDNCEKEACDLDKRGVETEALNLIDAKVGQKVRVDMKTYTYVKGAFILYVLPAIGLFAGAILGKTYLPHFFNGLNSDILSAAGGISFFLLSLVFVKKLSAKMEKKTEHKSVIESIVEDS